MDRFLTKFTTYGEVNIHVSSPFPLPLNDQSTGAKRPRKSEDSEEESKVRDKKGVGQIVILLVFMMINIHH